MEEKISSIIEILKNKYPDAPCALFGRKAHGSGANAPGWVHYNRNP